MMRAVLKVMAIICILGISGYGYGQDSSTRIEIKAQAKENKIKLRWAPSDAIGWDLLNKYGYTIERHTILRGDELVKPIKKIVIRAVLKPASLEYWKYVANSNDFAAIAAQAIYGNEFAVDAASTDILTMINKSRQLIQRFSFALLAADQSWEVAEFSGLGFQDSSVNSVEKYLYKIYGNVPRDLHEVDTGYVYVGVRDTAALPDSPVLKATFKNKTVELRWGVLQLRDFYNSYLIERSVDGSEFRLLSDKANLLAGVERIGRSTEIVKVDSLPTSGSSVSYRLRGKTAFGELGPPSNIVSGTSTAIFDIAAEIVSARINDEEQVQLEWEIEGNYEGAVEYYIERSSSSGGTYEVLNQEPVKQGQRYFWDEAPLPISYYKIVARAGEEEQNSSFPYLVQLQDSVPPTSPEQVRATIDSLGNVTVSWQAIAENDLSGYRVYRSNFRTTEFSQVTKEILIDTVYNEAVNLNTLTRKLYYYVTALDNRYNQSLRSEIIKLERPDKIAPAPPVLKAVSIIDEGIKIEWINSSSNDVRDHTIYRAGEDQQWTLMKPIKLNANGQGNWTDMGLPHSGIYQYKLVATDSIGNISESTKPITIRYVENKKNVRINNLKARIDRRNKEIVVMWEKPDVEVTSIVIYRSVNNEPMSLLTSLSAINNTYIDRNVSVSNTYTYGIKVIGAFSSGSQLVLSETLNY